MCHACRSPPPFPTPTCTPLSLRQISPLGQLVSHLPWSKHLQVFAFSYTSLDSQHSNKKVNPGFFHQTKCSTKTLMLSTDTGMEEKGCPISSASLTRSQGSFRLLQTLWSQLCQLWSLQKPKPRLNKTSTVSQDFQRRLVFSELIYPTGEVLKC